VAEPTGLFNAKLGTGQIAVGEHYGRLKNSTTSPAYAERQK